MRDSALDTLLRVADELPEPFGSALVAAAADSPLDGDALLRLAGTARSLEAHCRALARCAARRRLAVDPESFALALGDVALGLRRDLPADVPVDLAALLRAFRAPSRAADQINPP